MKYARSVAAAIVLATAGFAAGRASVSENHTAQPRVREGWAIMPTEMKAIACCGRDAAHAGGLSYQATPLHWRDLRTDDGHPWHELGQARPTCFNDTNTPLHVRIGVVDAHGGEGIGTDLIVWLECL